MEDNRGFNAGVWTILITFVAAIFTYIEFDPKLTSSRPPVKTDGVSSLIGDQKFPSRLWQDPLGESLKTSEKEFTDWKNLRNQIQTFRNQNYQCLVMPVMVEGFQYPEDIEVRLRLRYAVQIALASQNYKPNDRSHIGIASVDWPVESKLFATNEVPASPTGILSILLQFPSPVSPPYITAQKSEKEAKLLIPFEWFLRDDPASGNSAVLLLWLKEEEFADYPLTRCARLFEKWNFSPTNLPPIKLIGPRSSDTLARMVQDTNVTSWQSRTNLKIYSPEATAPDALITGSGLGVDYCTNKSRAKIEQAICKNLGNNNSFTNLTATDEELSRQLVKELKFRGVNTTLNSGDCVVLISETDTSYGRSLPICFAGTASFPDNAPACALAEFLNPPVKWPTNFLRYAYLRGLDGTPAKMESKPQESKKAGNAPENPRAIRSLDEYGRSEGESQLDYARRLTRELKLKNEKLNRHGREIKAIGVLGSDIYDKLILLQALRASFDRAIFFTTDLDARYLDPEQNPITRNLIVASSYGLEPNCKLKPSIPQVPTFRDCYQTAVFTACLNALGERSAQKGEIKMFEVGRTRAIELGCDEHVVHDDFLQGLTFTPCRYVGIVMIMIGGIGTLALLRSISRFLAHNYRMVVHRLYLFVGSLLPGSAIPGAAAPAMGANAQALRARMVIVTKREVFWTSLILTFGAALFAWFLWEAWIQRGQPDAEPIRFNEGVSIWPTETLRLAAAVLSFLFVAWSWFLYEKHRLQLQDEYFVSSEVPAASPARPAGGMVAWCSSFFHALNAWSKRATFAGLKRWRAGCSINFWPEPEGKVDAQELYDAFLLRGQFSNRMCRIIPTCICYLLVAFGIFLLFKFPVVPYRGDISLKVDHWVLALSIIGYCFLAFYVVDATRLTERFIYRLGDGETIWPQKIRNVYAQERHMDPEHLSGYVDVKFVAFHTKAIGRLFKYPFIVLSVMWVARNRFFDNWTWPLPMSIIFVLNAIIVFLCAFLIRRAASRVRKEAIESLRKIELKCISAPHKSYSWEGVDNEGRKCTLNATNYAEKVRHVIEEIRQVNMGSYTSWIKDSAVQALLIPGVGYGLITLFERLFF